MKNHMILLDFCRRATLGQEPIDSRLQSVSGAFYSWTTEH